MSRKSNSLLTFIVGAAAGAALGVLFAPDKGANIRDRLSFKLDKYKAMLEEMLEDLVNDSDAPVSQAKSKSEKVIVGPSDKQRDRTMANNNQAKSIHVSPSPTPFLSLILSRLTCTCHPAAFFI